jgi:hypothetical protein
MKIPAVLLALAALSCSPLALHAQAPAAATPAKKAALSSADKLLVKNAAEAQLVLIHLGEMMRAPTGPGSDSIRKLAATTNKLNEAWGDLGTLVMRGGGEMPKTDQTAAEKKEVAEMRKATGDKFDKAYMKAFTRETKKANTSFTNGEKYAVDPDLKAAFAKWQPIIAKLDADANAVEAEGKKK